MRGENVTLLCSSNSKPQNCNITFYYESHVIGTYLDRTCAGDVAASHLIVNISGCNFEAYSCKAENQYGSEEDKLNFTIKGKEQILLCMVVYTLFDDFTSRTPLKP